MKKLFIIITILFLVNSSSMALNWPWQKKSQPKQTPIPTQVEKKKEPATINNARQIVKELNTELQNAKAQNTKLKNNLERANTKILSAELETKKVQEAADKLKEWGIAQQSEKFKWMEKYEKLAKKYKLLKTIAVIIAAAAGVFLGLQFMALVPPPYNLAVPIGGAGLFALLIGIFL
jgi:peptidoglycan hydrolase CwlO-like protein